MRERASTPRRSQVQDTRRHLVAVLGVAAAVRIAFWAIAGRYAPHSDAAQYSELAYNVAHGHGFSSYFPELARHATAWRPPVYPFLLSGAFLVSGSSIAAGMVLNLLIGLGVVALTYLLVARLHSPLAALVAAGLVAVYPPLFVNDVRLLSEPVALLLILALVLCLHERRLVPAGVFTGLLVLARPSAQGLVVVVGGWCLWQLGWKRTLQVGALAALVVAPWVIRNVVQLHRPVLVTSNGFNLVAVYSAEAQHDGRFVDETKDVRFKDLRLEQFDEAHWDRVLQKRALHDLRGNPTYVGRVFGRNVLTFFELQPSKNRWPETLDGRAPGLQNGARPLFYLVSLAGIVGLWRARRRPALLLLALVATYFTITSLLLIAAPRLRAPLDLACCIGTGILVAELAAARLGLATTLDSGPPPGRGDPSGPGERAADRQPA
ncbi:MAG: Dolichyl-phosphate-mannose-protein mannosyltransferase [Acidimicrobiales bacterium]|nr:Dolichyl-phosphate-mannose-protein mannosyltransferase [Acidimicrobiales bacterium]